MEPIHSQLRNSVKVGALSDGLKRGETCIASGLWGAAYALIGATLMEDCHSSVLLIAPTLDAADAAFIDFGCFFSESESIRIFPESESLPSEDVPLNREILAQRLQLVRLLQAAEHASGLPRLIIASVQALTRSSRVDRWTCTVRLGRSLPRSAPTLLRSVPPTSTG